MSRVLIIGHGVVGKNLEYELKALRPDVLDKYKPDESTVPEDAEDQGYDLAFICVDTPFTETDPCDRSEVWNAVQDNKKYMKPNGIFVIKSTVLPGTTDGIRGQANVRVLFSPEYYGGTQHCNNFEFGFTILGGLKEDCWEVAQILQNVYDGRHRFRITDSRTAELVKYMENAWLATKVTFCRQFFDIAEKEGVKYEELRELFIMDPRVNPSHTFVYRDRPFWDSHCLNKDVPAITIYEGATFLQNVIDYNASKKLEMCLKSEK